jgi:hypothetical protein
VCPEVRVDCPLPDHSAAQCPVLAVRAPARSQAFDEPPVQGAAISLREMAHLYDCLGRSTYAVARQAGIERQRVARLLTSAGIALRPRGAGGRRPGRREKEPADLLGLLRDLYVQRALSSTEIARMLGMKPRTVRARLAEAGIARRHRGNRPPSARKTLAEADLDTLYVKAELSAEEVGEVLDASRGTVLRNAHETGLPVRIGGPAPRSGPESIELIDALYADPLVAAALERHRVPVRGSGGRLWERFPQPVPLTGPMLADLYAECGISITHIELLTGRPAVTVQRALITAGIMLRSPGGRSPFMRRWRQSARNESQPFIGAVDCGHMPNLE